MRPVDGLRELVLRLVVAGVVFAGPDGRLSSRLRLMDWLVVLQLRYVIGVCVRREARTYGRPL